MWFMVILRIAKIRTTFTLALIRNDQGSNTIIFGYVHIELIKFYSFFFSPGIKSSNRNF